MKSKKRSRMFFIPIVILLFIISVTLYMIFNPLESQDGVKLNLFEQRWIESNKNTIINVLIPNNVPLYSNEGRGIAFSFLEYFENQTELEFNKTPYTIGEKDNSKENRFRIIRSEDKLKDNDLLFYRDNYVVVSKATQSKTPLDKINGNIGVLSEDFDTVSSYISGDKVTVTKVINIEDLVESLDKGEIAYIIIPKNRYLDMVIEKDYHIINTLSELSLKYVLTLENDNNRLNDIIKKYYDAWTNVYLANEYHSELYNLYTTIKKVDDKSKTDFKSKRYVYGYVENVPYEITSNEDFGGISGEFIKSFTSFSGVEFNFKKFKDASLLNNALEKGDIDIALNYYDLNTANTNKTLDLLYSKYMILTNDKDIIVDTITSLPNENIYILKDTKLASYIKKYGRFDIKEVNNVSDLRGKDIIAVDSNTYAYYQNTYFDDYFVSYSSSMNDNYAYVINKSLTNNLFYTIFDYYLSTLNHEQYRLNGIDKALNKTINFDLSLLWLYVILVPILATIVILIISKRKKIVKVRNDVKLKYIDPLTSLKNRYYLNNNITKWEENNIYPQAIVVINVNNLKDINDAYGHEGGDQIIKTAANILINNQIEKTDIVRSDGNEFIIYMVEYDESAVIAYVRKLYRLLKDLPYGYGSSLGYSMIEDDIKTIEDAINEAILDMVTNRETKKNNEI